uniref:Uncharacterized protein n=1 Tax=Romanomermis culicivorax TaxID=13658 RepID=A0A915KWX3_ROMCU
MIANDVDKIPPVFAWFKTSANAFGLSISVQRSLFGHGYRGLDRVVKSACALNLRSIRKFDRVVHRIEPRRPQRPDIRRCRRGRLTARQLLTTTGGALAAADGVRLQSVKNARVLIIVATDADDALSKEFSFTPHNILSPVIVVVDDEFVSNKRQSSSLFTR